MLTFGAVLGGPESYPTHIKVIKISKYFDHTQKEVGDEAEINIIYHIPGSVLQNDFTGVRDGIFSKKERRVVIQVAVPKEITLNKNEDEVWEYLTQSIVDSIKLGKEKFDWYEVKYDSCLDLKILEQMETEIPLDKYDVNENIHNKDEEIQNMIDEECKKLGFKL